jgi:hypothetical protein
VHLDEQRGHLLDLVDDDLRGRRSHPGELFAERLRALDVPPELVRAEEVDSQRVRVRLTEERRLARLARTPKEEGLRTGGR